MENKLQLNPPYTALAEIYDMVMEDVDYHLWADFIDDLIQIHHPAPKTILELAAGTGSLALKLAEFGDYRITGTDKSEAMLKKARAKARQKGRAIPFLQMNFLENNLPSTFDIIVSIFDSVNYLHSKREIRQLLAETKKVMNAQSLFIFDFTTPRNSAQAIRYLNNVEATTANNYHFLRKSRYDDQQQIHYNVFKIQELADDQQTVLREMTEEHQQKAYSLTQMQAIIAESEFNIVSAYGEFDLKKATSKSLRVTMVLRCPTIQ